MTLSRWPHEFPKGYKQYRVLDLMQSKNGLTYTEIVKFAFELSNECEYTDSNRGYWSGAFVKKSGGAWYGSKVDGWITKYCTKGSDGKYRPNLLGMDKIDDLELKFKGIHAKQALSMKKVTRAEEVLKATPKPVTKVEAFKEKYAEPLANFNERQEAKAATPNPEVNFRGLKLGDKVAYYSKNGNKSGVGYVFSTTEFAQGTHITPKLKVRDSLTNVFGQGLELHYDEKLDKFMDGIKECELIKI